MMLADVITADPIANWRRVNMVIFLVVSSAQPSSLMHRRSLLIGAGAAVLGTAMGRAYTQIATASDYSLLIAPLRLELAPGKAIDTFAYIAAFRPVGEMILRIGGGPKNKSPIASDRSGGRQSGDRKFQFLPLAFRTGENCPASPPVGNASIDLLRVLPDPAKYFRNFAQRPASK